MSWFGTVRAGYGTVLLLVPDRVTRAYTGNPGNRTVRTVVRVLGARQLAQGVADLGPADTLVLALGVQADLAHAASMLALAATDPRRRRAGLLDAAVAATFATIGAILTRRASISPPPSDGTPGTLIARRRTVAAWLTRRTLPAQIRDTLG